MIHVLAQKRVSSKKTRAASEVQSCCHCDRAQNRRHEARRSTRVEVKFQIKQILLLSSSQYARSKLLNVCPQVLHKIIALERVSDSWLQEEEEMMCPRQHVPSRQEHVSQDLWKQCCCLDADGSLAEKASRLALKKIVSRMSRVCLWLEDLQG